MWPCLDKHTACTHTHTHACTHARMHTHTHTSVLGCPMCTHVSVLMESSSAFSQKFMSHNWCFNSLYIPKCITQLKIKNNNNQHDKQSRTQFMGRFYSCTNDKTFKDHDIADLNKWTASHVNQSMVKQEDGLFCIITWRTMPQSAWHTTLSQGDNSDRKN